MGRYGEVGSRNQSLTPLRRDGTSSALSSAVPHPCRSTSVAHTRMRAGSSGAAGSSSPPRRAADASESKDSPSPPESISSARKRWSFGACSQEGRCEETPFTARRGRGRSRGAPSGGAVRSLAASLLTSCTLINN